MIGWKKFTLTLVAIFTLTSPVVSPAQATAPTETGDIYYWGAWDNGIMDYTGMHKYNLDTMTDQRLGTGSASCTPLIGQPSGIAVDPLHNKLFWSITDGNTGLFAMDLSTGTCYTISNDYNIRGVEIIPATQTLIWSTSNGDMRFGKVSVANLASIPAPTYIDVTIPGNGVLGVNDIVLYGSRVYYMVFGDRGSGATSQVYSTGTATSALGRNLRLEKDSGLAQAPQQLQITDSAFYFNIIAAQVVKMPRDGSTMTGFLDVDQVFGFAVANGKMYSLKARDTELKSIALTDDSQNMTALPGNVLVDMSSYLRYSKVKPGGLTTPKITATNTVSTSGVAAVPFSGTTVSGTKRVIYGAVAADNSGRLSGFCTVTSSKCYVTGLDDSKQYNIQLTVVYTYEDPLNPGNRIMTIAAEPSDITNINDPNPPADPNGTQTFRGFNFEKAALSSAIKAEIQAWVNDHAGATKVQCTGYTGYNSNHRTAWSIKNLATKRANNVCSYIHSLNSSIRIVSVKAVNESSKRAATRRVYVKLSN